MQSPGVGRPPGMPTGFGVSSNTSFRFLIRTCLVVRIDGSASDFRRSVRERRAARQHDGTRSRRIGPPRRRELRVEVFAHVQRT